MVPTYDIFAGRFGFTEVLWLESVEGLGNANERMNAIAVQKPGSYFVFCTRTHQKMAAIDTRTKEEQKGSECA